MAEATGATTEEETERAPAGGAGEEEEYVPRPSAGPLGRPQIVLGAVIGLSFLLLMGLTAVGLLTSRPSGGAAGSTTPLPQFDMQIGSLAPDFELEDAYTGERVALRDLRGSPVWINFWASWCPPCREEMPQMQQIYERYRDRDLRLLGINVEESPEEIRAFTTELKLTFTFLSDRDGKVQDTYRVPGLPSHYFVDRQGIVRALYMGDLKDAPVDDFLSKIMGR